MSATALVTGGHRGIGLGIVRRLLTDGYRVAILDVLPESAETTQELEKLGEVHYVQGDITDEADRLRFVTEAVDRWGRLDLLVNNAGVAPLVRADLLETTQESFDRVLDINLRGTFFLTQLVSHKMIELRGALANSLARPVGTVVNIGSASATMVSTNRGEYCMSKAALVMMTKLFAVRLAAEGIAVFEVRPGVIETDMTRVVKAKYDKLILEDGGVPIARWGQPADVADAVALLASGNLPYSTGDTIFADGGMHIRTL